jgi:ferredoxin/coenzyme F420-reducing hydrogenase delta subunit
MDTRHSGQDPGLAEGRLRGTLRRAIEWLDVPFDYAFTPVHNPLKQLGALGWFFYWIVAGSGLYLYAVFDTGITNAYASVEWLTHEQWYLGGVMRSLHRYASDAMVVVLAAHVAREFAKGRYRGARAFSWLSGVPLVAFLIASGITGYWLVWDELAQYVAIVTSEWLDSLGIFGESMARNFLNSSVLSSRFFTLMAFLHIAIPLFLLLGLWIHVQRQSHARVNPTRPLAIGTALALTALSLLLPAVSQAPANLDRVPAVVQLDWFYLAAYPLLDWLAPATVWLLAFGAAFVFVIVPWVPRRTRAPAAVVDLANCNGCGRCVADCPFNAIEMKPRTDGTAYSHEAVVDTNLCTGCNVCMGSCPTATPFRRASGLTAGIAVPGHDLAALQARTTATAAALTGRRRILVYACEEAARVANAASNVGVVTVPCVGAIPPSFIDYALSQQRADGVVLAACAPQDCQYRLGDAWAEARIARTRDPYLRERVPRERIEIVHCGHSPRALVSAIDALSARLPEREAAVPAHKDAHT